KDPRPAHRGQRVLSLPANLPLARPGPDSRSERLPYMPTRALPPGDAETTKRRILLPKFPVLRSWSTNGQIPWRRPGRSRSDSYASRYTSPEERDNYGSERCQTAPGPTVEPGDAPLPRLPERWDNSSPSPSDRPASKIRASDSTSA